MFEKMQRFATVFLLVLGLGAARAQLLSGITTELTSAEGDVLEEFVEDSSSFSASTGSSSTGSSATSNPGESSTSTAVTDPRVVDFSGRHFKFTGEAGNFYNVIQDEHHQVSMRLKIGVLSDHIGTYIDGIGFAYQGHKIVIELLGDNTLAVSLDGERLTMVGSETVQEHSLPLARGNLRITWELHRPSYGNTISIQTDLLRFVVFRTEEGSLTKSGFTQPAFLNFDAELLYPPAHHLQGVVGKGYTRVLTGEAQALPDDDTFYGNPQDYRLPHYFPEGSPAAQKALQPSMGAYRRLLAPAQAQLALAGERVASGIAHLSHRRSMPAVRHASLITA